MCYSIYGVNIFFILYKKRVFELELDIYNKNFFTIKIIVL